MANSKELIQGLRDGFDALTYPDENELNKLKTGGDMLIRRVFGESSEYLRKFKRIEFHVMVSPIPEHFEREAWDRGKSETLNLLDTMLEDLKLSEAKVGARASNTASPELSNRIFVVHGRDDGMRESVARVLTTLGLEPVILHEQADRGRTIIEKFYEHSDVGFAVVLLSPDDSGYLISDGPDAVKPRARQNVILELSFFLGRLGRENVVALYKGDVEIPSDFSGVLYKRYDSDGAWPYKLTRELKESGYEVSADNL